ncbi:uncharacterized protein CEXT_626281 [Caerostris extrusa]|uniref:Uncharacterized protein n=1 Tax=Caerostris extrusa TaxID=172846 RepID=A0AAV4U7S5_CAEEX|nr:uncharacterized protein CEXT_626281 [Caerostris extrusa]
MSPIFSSTLLLLASIFANAFANNLTATENGTDSIQRSARWYQDNHPEIYINPGEYASPSKPYYSVDSREDDDQNDKSKSKVPTSFADFLPDQRYSSSKGQSKVHHRLLETGKETLICQDLGCFQLIC